MKLSTELCNTAVACSCRVCAQSEGSSGLRDPMNAAGRATLREKDRSKIEEETLKIALERAIPLLRQAGCAITGPG